MSYLQEKKQGLIYYTVSSFRKTGLVRHAFTTRVGGVSRDEFKSLNLSLLTRDSLENVLENRKRVAAVLNLNLEEWVGTYQIHSDRIHQVTIRDKGKGATDPQTVIPGMDGMISNEKGLVLLAFFADCVPLLFLDPVNKAIGLAHAGWRGTVARIGAKTVEAMEQACGTNPQDLLVAIGPSIGPCHYQVDEPVIKEVQREFPDDHHRLLMEEEKGYAKLDLWRANTVQLVQMGVLKENIEVTGLCTSCRREEFFSHRLGDKGRQAALIMLK